MQHGRGNMEPDQTLEILMTDLDPNIMRIFTKEACKSGQEATLVINVQIILHKDVRNCKYLIVILFSFRNRE